MNDLLKYIRAEKRIKDFQQKNSSEKQRIEGMESSARHGHILFVVLNSLGLVFGVIASFFQNKWG
jgi:hypothetical protein